MPATYTPVPRSVPSAQRSAIITSVEDGDTINFLDVLGRPARRVQVTTTDAADSVSYKLNHRQVHRTPATQPLTDAGRVWGVYGSTEAEVYSGAGGIGEYTTVGEEWTTAEGLSVSAIEITSLTLSVGTTITIVCW